MPKIVLVYGEDSVRCEKTFMITDAAYAQSNKGQGTNSCYDITISWSGNTVSWYSTDGAAGQLNYNEKAYRYAAIG